MKTIYLRALVILCVLLPTVHYQIFSHPFLGDDQHVILEDDSIHDLQNIPGFFTTSWKLTRLYRPLVQTSLAIDYALYGKNPTGYRVSSLLWHIVLCFLVFVLLQQLQLPSFVCWTACILYAVHPIHTEVINYASCRGDTMCACFCVLAWIMYQRKEHRYLWLSVGSFVLGCLCKEIAVALPLVIAADIILHKQKSWRVLIPFIVATFLYLVVRFYALQSLGESHTAFYGLAFITRLATMCWAFLLYILLCIFPVGMGRDYQLNDFPIIDNWGSIYLWLGLVSVVAFFAAVAITWRKKPWIAFGMCWFFLFLLPVSNIIPTAIVMAERFLVLPLIPLMIAIAYSVYIMPKGKAVTRTLLMVAYCMLSAYYNNYWSNEKAYYLHRLELSPNSYIAHMKLGKIYLQEQSPEEAIPHFVAAVEKRCYPQNTPFAPFNCSKLLFALGQPRQAFDYVHITKQRLDTIVHKNSQHYAIYFAIGQNYFSYKDWKKATQCFVEVLSDDTAQAETRQKSYSYAAAGYHYQGQFSQAIPLYENLLREFPKYGPGYYNFALLCLQQEDIQRAKELLEQAQKLGFRVPEQVLERTQKR